jgi:anaerobic sulfite reductase subunit B
MPYIPKSYKITNIKTFTQDVKLFELNCNLNPKPGQFIEVSIPGFGECPLASCSSNPKKINLLTRKAGNVTSRFFKLKKGDPLFIRGPYGNGFPLKELENKNLLLIAGGTGIAPITSLINYIEQNRKKFKNITIYFGFRNSEYILLKEQLKKWKKKFNLTICIDNNPDKKTNFKDPFNCKIGFTQEIINKNKPSLDNTIALMCGPEIMVQLVTKTLNLQGLTNDKIYWSLERRMECAFGNCNRCLIQDLYVCKDGPIFRYDIIKPRLDNEESNNER